MITTDPIRTVAVLGAGTMGHGIAQVSAMAGMEVQLYDADPGRVEAGLSRIRANLDKGVERGKVEGEVRDRTLERLGGAGALEEACAEADLVIEAVPERMEIKREVFGRVDAVAPEHAILATNTSSLSVSRIAEATGRPERVLGLHFFNPVHIMTLLEVVRGDRTSPEVLEAALDFAERIGKEPIVVTDSPGFASSRLAWCWG